MLKCVDTLNKTVLMRVKRSGLFLKKIVCVSVYFFGTEGACSAPQEDTGLERVVCVCGSSKQGA